MRNSPINVVFLISLCGLCIGQASAPQSTDPPAIVPPDPETPEPPEPVKSSTEDPTKASSPAAGRAVNNPAKDTEEIKPLSAVVLEVGGSVDWAKPGVSALANDGWTGVKVNDRFESGTQIRTGLRSFVNLQFGQTTTVSVRSATYASIDQFYASTKVESVRIGVGYGTVRGGSSEGEVKSDVIVDSPVATLAKRGTEGWEIEVEPMTGRFRVSLAQYGIVEAIQKLSDDRTRSRTVLPGQYATHANIANMWVKQDIFDRNVTFYTPESTTFADAEFGANNTRGYGVLSPGGGMELRDLSQRVSASQILDRTNNDLPPTIPPVNTAIGVRGVLTRPEGNFGTGTSFRAVAPQRSR